MSRQMAVLALRRAWRPGMTGRRRQRSPSSESKPCGTRHEHVGENVRQVRDRGQQRVVGLGVERRRARAEADEQRCRRS
jgi:hypothetical protein